VSMVGRICERGRFWDGSERERELNVLPATIEEICGAIRDNADIDECATNNGGCSALADCSDTPGSYTCTCKPGYTGDGVSCTGRQVKTHAQHCASHALCATVCKTVRPMLSNRCQSALSVCLSVCEVGVLWPNG